jgi:superfamily I DNA/RNA helicase
MEKDRSFQYVKPNRPDGPLIELSVAEMEKRLLSQLNAPNADKTPTSDRAIACATIHSFKGLESPVVILTETAEPDTNRLRQLSYVGSSRAQSHLVTMRPL